MELVFQSWDEIKLTENHIKQLHRDLLVYSAKDERHRGEYKTNSNSIAAFNEEGKQIGIVFETATPFDTPKLMEELEQHSITLERFDETDFLGLARRIPQSDAFASVEDFDAASTKISSSLWIKH